MPKIFDGLPIHNAKEKLVFTITPPDIRGAKIKDHENCAGARAIKRECHAKKVMLGRDRAIVHYADDRVVRYRLGRAIKHEMIVNDRHGRVAPGTYQLTPMGKAKSRGRRQGSKTNQNAKGGTKRMTPIGIPDIRLDMEHAMKGRE